MFAGILRRTSIELGSGTVSFDVSLLSDLTSQQKAIMTNLQVNISCSYICHFMLRSLQNTLNQLLTSFFTVRMLV